MKKLLTLGSMLILVLVLVFLGMSCAQPSQNTNSVSNANTNTANATPRLTDCSYNGITAEMNDIVKDAGLEDQNKGTGNQYQTKNIQFKTVQIESQWVLLIEGGISDGKKNDPSKNSEHMEKFVKAVDEIVTKTCVSRAIFVNRGTIERIEKGSLAAGDIVGFDWSTCDWPNIACPNGQCAERCPDKNPAATPGSNSNGNSNGNGNSNANTNAKRAP